MARGSVQSTARYHRHVTLPDPPLLLITDRTMVRVSLEAALERSFDGGCRWVVIREKDLASDERLKLVETILKIADPYNAKILVNADMKAAEIAHGVHLPQGQSCTHARATLSPDKIIGVSAHTIGEAGAAASAASKAASFSVVSLEGGRDVSSTKSLRASTNTSVLEKTVWRRSAQALALAGRICR